MTDLTPATAPPLRGTRPVRLIVWLVAGLLLAYLLGAYLVMPLGWKPEEHSETTPITQEETR
jgi:hypothetical protein